MKVSLLSNVNTDYILRLLAKNVDCVPSVGYGDVWGQLLDPESALNKSEPDIIVFLTDIEQLTDGCIDEASRYGAVDDWFSVFDTIIKKGKDYFVSDVLFRSEFISYYDSAEKYRVTNYWFEKIEKRMSAFSNIHFLKINDVISKVGQSTVFSDKMWYMGKIPYSSEGCKIIAKEIEKAVDLLTRTTKKVLILDLDNTLWGGVVGEVGADGIELSDDHIGAVYKKVQKQIKAIKETGILLAIASKNNEQDVQEVWDKNPHMLLKRNDFISVKIDWNDKAENIAKLSKELNLGLDSFVFIDDMAPERDNIRLRLPEVIVPDFPDKIEDYPLFIEEVFNRYFLRMRLSSEDKVKSRQYTENILREEASKGLSFEDFLKSLKLNVEKVDLDDSKLDRIAQLHGKTNQFNLTTIRYTRQDIDRLIKEGNEIYAYNVKDKFGDYGLVAVAIVDIQKSEIRSFLMSCRVMGKLIENYVVDEIEKDLVKKGKSIIRAKYIKTAKNAPVEKLFDGLGYQIVSKTSEETDYELDLNNRPNRKYYVNR